MLSTLFGRTDRVSAKLGYKQELRRTFTLFEIFGIAFSIMGLLPSIASTLAYSIPAGPVGLVWGWFLASMFIFIVGLAMADLGWYLLIVLVLSADGVITFRLCSTYKWWTLLVDTLLCQSKDTQRSFVPGWLFQHSRPCWRALLYRLRLQSHVYVRHCHRKGRDLDS